MLSFDYRHQLLELGSIYSTLYNTTDCSRSVIAADNKINMYRIAVNDSLGKIEQLLIMLNCIKLSRPQGPYMCVLSYAFVLI